MYLKDLSFARKERRPLPDSTSNGLLKSRWLWQFSEDTIWASITTSRILEQDGLPLHVEKLLLAEVMSDVRH